MEVWHEDTSDDIISLIQRKASEMFTERIWKALNGVGSKLILATQKRDMSSSHCHGFMMIQEV